MKSNVKILLMSILFSFVSLDSHSQTVKDREYYKTQVGLFDSQKRKNGFWVESLGSDIRIELYYKSGIRHGIYKCFSGKDLVEFGEYKEGALTGIFYYFFNSGHLNIQLNDFTKNNSPVLLDGIYTTPPYKCYIKTYNPNGTIMKEGILLFEEQEDPINDFSYEYGEWKYYDENGILKEVKHCAY